MNFQQPQLQDKIIDKKQQEYKKRIREIEQENEHIGTQLTRARQHIKRLRIERIVLLEEIDELRQGRSSRFKKSNGIGMSGGADSDSEMSLSESIMSDVKTPGRKNAAATPRKKRDPNAPKGPGNVFFLYCRMERDNIKDEVPNESLGEVTRLLGQKWKALTKEEKQKYYDIYKKEQEEYESAMKSYTAAGGGAEGAAAVEANKVKQDEDESEESEEEIDMLQDEDEDEDEDEEIDHTRITSIINQPEPYQ
ncbi:high mobility group box domain-containing protein [Gilbertella persicaria]|uniref:high mobility group box domain-containing protein n=1 Tax=Gilbertella persicaria TaxID=101096 RepID=UPI00221FB491|nr:high mobility group box domain-containing protein [Gilbertella persicaria]KAI8087899.1 high mobility group box domain-containing protein [Gilbertella persicaria]